VLRLVFPRGDEDDGKYAVFQVRASLYHGRLAGGKTAVVTDCASGGDAVFRVRDLLYHLKLTADSRYLYLFERLI
jgi:hypothetical protein